MTGSQLFIQKDSSSVEWPYPIRYGVENEIIADVLVLGGGASGCFAAIAAAKKGAKVALLEKGVTKRSGSGGAGVDHWHYAAGNPCTTITPEELTRALIDAWGGYSNGISDYIMCSASYETLLELEKMGGKVRDTEDRFKGAEFRDEKTKLLFAYDYENRTCIRVWGTTFKPALYRECKRLGVQVYDRVMATSLLTEGGKQGTRVIGATGLNVRTGEFYKFAAKATVMCMGFPARNWNFSTEQRGLTQFTAPTKAGNGCAMAWRAGAEFTMMERSKNAPFESPYAYPHFGVGSNFSSWYACTLVDANGKEVPWIDRDGRLLTTVSERYRPAPGQRYLLHSNGLGSKDYKYRLPRLIPDLEQRIRKGEFVLPLYADLPGMPDHERRALWGLMVGEEGKTKFPIVRHYEEAGFDPDKDLLQGYYLLSGDMTWDVALPQERLIFGNAGGLVVDWDLRTTLEGLYAAGEQAFGTLYFSGATTSGRWAGGKAAEYALKPGKARISRKQVEAEKRRVYGPVGREDGIDWKEFNSGLCRVMQNYCGGVKTEELLNIGLITLREIAENEAQTLHADNPHKLSRALDTLDVLTCDQIIIYSCLARKASSEALGFARIDYPEVDPPGWHKWITVRQVDGTVRTGEMPIDFHEPLESNYKLHGGK
jgi:succinate dehydrogenase/fumarate reductase flavoprotein subunit